MSTVDDDFTLLAQNQALRERIETLERVLANLGVVVNAGGSLGPVGEEGDPPPPPDPPAPPPHDSDVLGKKRPDRGTE
jgi:hypothetical protein